jgi:glucokinase
MGAELAIGVDIGGTKTLAVVADETGSVHAEVIVETPDVSASSAYAEQVLVSIIEELASQHGPLPVGLSVAGLIDFASGKLRFAPHLPWQEVFLAERLQHLLDGTGITLPAMDNDVNAALWAESRFGAARGQSDVIMVTVGTGIGGAIQMDGRLYRGRNGMAGEFGHILFEPDGLPCECGLSGCWEQYASGNALTRQMRMLGRDLSGPQIMEAARAGDQDAQAAFATIGQALGSGLAGLVASLDPALVIIGGGVSAAGELLLQTARRALNDGLIGLGHREPPELSTAALGPAAGAIGAADMARSQV